MVDPVFILASPRSFTSVFSGILGQHPDLFGAPELHFIQSPTLGDFLQLKTEEANTKPIHGLLRLVAQLYAGEQTINSVSMARRWIISRIDIPSSDVFRELNAKVNPYRLVDKSPGYGLEMQRLNALESTFPNAFYIHLIRHPRAQCESLFRLLMDIRPSKKIRIDIYGKPSRLSQNIINTFYVQRDADNKIVDMYADLQLLWFRMQKRIESFLATIPPSRKLQVRGEDLLGDLQPSLASLCSAVNIPYNDFIYHEMLHPENSAFACIGPLGAEYGNDINYLLDPSFKPRKAKKRYLDEGPLPWLPDGKGFNREVIKLAKSYGYE